MKSSTKFRMLFYPVVTLLALANLFSSCSEEIIPFESSDCSIVSLKLKSGENVLLPQIFKESVQLIADYDQELSNLTVEYELSEGATIEPDLTTITDWSEPMTFVLTASDQQTQKTYKYEVTRDYLNPDSYCQKEVYLRTQKEVEEFGKNNFRKVRSLIVCDSEEDPITDLSALNSIWSVEKNFTIKGFHGTEVVLDNLKEVATLDIASKNIHSISASKLENVNNLYVGYISEDQNKSIQIDSLANLNFTSLKKIKGNFGLFFFNKNPEFAVNGFENLESIDGDIIFNFPTVNYKIFSKITKVSNIMISGRVGSLEGFENLKEITGIFCTSFLQGPKSLLPFAPEKVHSIQLLNCQQFNNLDFCKNITKVYDFEIGGAFGLKSLKGMESIKEIENSFKMRYTSVKNLDGLSNLEKVGKLIKITYNNSLEDFSGLKKCLENFKGEWIVEGNRQNPTIKDILGK